MSSPLHNRKMKQVVFDLGGTTFQCQLENIQIVNNTPDGEKIFSLCPDGEAREETDADYALQLRYFADWRVGGISDFLQTHDGETVAFEFEHHPDIPTEHTIWTGDVVIKAPNVGGDVRVTERQEVTLSIIGTPEYTRP